MLRLHTIRPAPDETMPTITEYMALAVAMHDQLDYCDDRVGFEECVAREADIEEAVRILVALRKDGWRMLRDVNATDPMWPDTSDQEGLT